MKILIVINNFRVANGVATVIMNQYEGLIEEKNQVDFIQFLNFESKYTDVIKKNGGKIYTVNKNFNSFKELYKIIKVGNYDIVHINQMNLQTVFLSVIARLRKVKCVIYHSHNTTIPGGIKRQVLQRACNTVYNIFSTNYIACSSKAGKDIFKKKKFYILKNSIDVKKFEYNYIIRQKYRNEYNIGNDTFVVGTICRYCEQKNPIFMIEIFSQILKIRPDSLFLWIGSAPSDNDPIVRSMYKKVKELGIEDKIRWLGSKEDVHNWYSVMDVFFMPSRWEGLGITYIEAQANSLPTFASDVVPIETKITNLISYLSLNDSAKVWAKEMCKCLIRNEDSKKDNYSKFVDNGYDIKYANKELTKMYSLFMKE